MIIAAERRKSDFSPTLAAMMKSAGEQSAGHASLQGFSSQYSHRFSSACNWALVREPSFVFIALMLINHFYRDIARTSHPHTYCPLLHFFCQRRAGCRASARFALSTAVWMQQGRFRLPDRQIVCALQCYPSESSQAAKIFQGNGRRTS
jgi:hypothetical protein